METDLVRSFLAVARTGSFTAAARELGYVQSTVTGHVHALERAVGARLLDRLPSGSVPTEVGRRLLPLAQDLLDVEARLGAAVTEEAAGAVRVAAPESTCAYRLPTAIADLRRRAPGVRISPLPAGTAAALEAVRAASVDLAIVLEPALRASDLEVRRLGAEPVAVVASPGARPQRSWAGLADEDALLLEEGCSYSDDAVRRLIAAGQPAGRRTHFGSIEAIKQCVAAGLGWTVLPHVAVAGDLAAGRLATVTGPSVETPEAHLVRHPGRAGSAAVRCVEQQLADLWAAG